jgi:hypothetical protein
MRLRVEQGSDPELARRFLRGPAAGDFESWARALDTAEPMVIVAHGDHGPAGVLLGTLDGREGRCAGIHVGVDSGQQVVAYILALRWLGALFQRGAECALFALGTAHLHTRQVLQFLGAHEVGGWAAIDRETGGRVVCRVDRAALERIGARQARQNSLI